MSGLLQFPKVLTEASDRRRGVGGHLCSIETEQSSAFGKMAIITNVDPYFAVLCLKHRVARLPGLKILLPEATGLRNMVLVHPYGGPIGVENDHWM